LFWGLTTSAQDTRSMMQAYHQAMSAREQTTRYKQIWEAYTKPYSIEKEEKLLKDLAVAPESDRIILQSVYAALCGVKGLFDESNRNIDEILNGLDREKYRYVYLKLILVRGINALKKLQFDRSGQFFTEVRDLADKYGYTEDRFSAEMALLSGYLVVRKPDKVVQELEKIKARIKPEDMPMALPKIYRTLSTVYMLKSIQDTTGYKTQMLQYSNLCEEAAINVDDHLTLFGNYFALGTYYSGIEFDAEKAGYYLRKAVQIGLKAGSLREVYMTYNFLIQNSIKSNQLNEAEQFAKDALTISKGLDIEEFQMEKYYSLAGIYLKKREDNLVLAMIDSIRSTTIQSYNKRYDEKYAELQTRYETVEKEKQINLLDKENALKQLIIAEQRNTLKQKTLDELKRRNEIDLLNKDKLLLNQKNELLSKDNDLKKASLIVKESEIQQERAAKELQRIQIEKLQATEQYNRLRTWFIFGISLAAVISISLFYVYLRNKQQQKAALEKQRYEVELLESRLSVYSAQMNPHFMFNSMNAVNHFILNNNPMEASRYLTKYAKLMRQVLDHSREVRISLERELLTLCQYIEMEQLRFGGSFQYELQTSEEIDTSEVMVPPLLLQPFAENAICHGFLHADYPGQLTIRVLMNHDWVICEIEDNGIGRKRSAEIRAQQNPGHQSAGLEITRSRLKVSLGKRMPEQPVVYIDKMNDVGKAAGTVVRIQLAPYQV
jgi:hypothetical protein